MNQPVQWSALKSCILPSYMQNLWRYVQAFLVLFLYLNKHWLLSGSREIQRKSYCGQKQFHAMFWSHFFQFWLLIILLMAWVVLEPTMQLHVVLVTIQNKLRASWSTQNWEILAAGSLMAIMRLVPPNHGEKKFPMCKTYSSCFWGVDQNGIHFSSAMQ